MTATDYQFEYVEGQGRPTYPALLETFAQRGAQMAHSAGAQLDLPYGPHERQRLDLFPSPAAQPQGVLLYLHAGYWQSRDKSLFRWLAGFLNARGLHVVFANYPLCPEVSLRELVDAVAPAVAATHGLRPEWAALPLVLAGHSAGGHLACELGLRYGARTERLGRVEGVWAMSGIYELPALCSTTLNHKLQLDEAQALAMSPVTRALPLDLPATWVVGAEETPEFLRQNRQMHQAWLAQGNWSRCVEVAGADHFSLLPDWEALAHGMQPSWDDWWQQVQLRHARQA